MSRQKNLKVNLFLIDYPAIAAFFLNAPLAIALTYYFGVQRLAKGKGQRATSLTACFGADASFADFLLHGQFPTPTFFLITCNKIY
jgi:hypothetical protein